MLTYKGRVLSDEEEKMVLSATALGAIWGFVLASTIALLLWAC